MELKKTGTTSDASHTRISTFIRSANIFSDNTTITNITATTSSDSNNLIDLFY